MAASSLSLTIAVPTTSRVGASFEKDVSRVALFRSLPSTQLSAKAVSYSQRSSAFVVRAQFTEDAPQVSSYDAPAPSEGVKLYVGNLPWNVDSSTLAEIFQDAGVVEEVEVICDRDTGRSRGFAFVVMSSPEDAQAAIQRFDGSDLGGRPLKVNFPTPPGERAERRSPDRQQRGPPGAMRGGGSRMGGARQDSPNKLYVGNLSWGVDDLALQDLFGEFGKVLEARVVTDRETGRSRGFGFVTLSNEGEVSQAVSNLDGAEFDGRQLRVNPAGEKPM